jgi:hypothetical protein
MSIQTPPAIVSLTALALCLLLSPGSATRVVAAATAGHGAAQRAAPGAGTETAPYRVDMHFEQDGQRHVMRHYVDGNRSRMEMELDGEKIVTIELGDADHTTYTVMASQKQVMKFSASAASTGHAAEGAHAAASPGDDEPPMELVGTDIIDGKPAQKYAVRMGGGTSFVWLDASTELPVRMEADGMRVEMKDYDFSPPAPELFELPKGYEVVDLNQMMRSFSPGRMAIGGVAGALGDQLGSDAGGGIGATIGGAFGGPLGSMVGRFIGQRIGRALGRRGATAAVSPK